MPQYRFAPAPWQDVAVVVFTPMYATPNLMDIVVVEATADNLAPFQHPNLQTGLGQIEGAGQTIVAASDDNGVIRLGHGGSSIGSGNGWGDVAVAPAGGRGLMQPCLGDQAAQLLAKAAQTDLGIA